MRNRTTLATGFGLLLAGLIAVALAAAGQDKPAQPPADKPKDAVADAQTPRPVPADRPEQKPTDHDRSDKFAAAKAMPVNSALKDQPQEGKITGFVFARDPL